MPADPYQMQLAQTMLGLKMHGHHSHGHPPYPSHDPPHSHGAGWWPPGTGPFRPGPGAPSFGARMPMSHRPGVTFGPAHRPANNRTGPYGWEGRGVRDYSDPSHTPVGIGSRQRWHSVTHMMSGTPVFGASKLSQPEIAQLRQMMINALGFVKGGRPSDATSAAEKLFQRQTQNVSATTRLQDLFSKASAPSAKSELERYLFLGPAAAQYAAQQQAKNQAAVAMANYKASGSGWGGGSGTSSSYAPQPGDPGFDASLNVNVNIPQPSLPPPPSASAKGSISF